MDLGQRLVLVRESAQQSGVLDRDDCSVVAVLPSGRVAATLKAGPHAPEWFGSVVNVFDVVPAEQAPLLQQLRGQDPLSFRVTVCLAGRDGRAMWIGVEGHKLHGLYLCIAKIQEAPADGKPRLEVPALQRWM